MNSFTRKIGDKGAYAKYYIQETNQEIDLNRKFPTVIICPGGAYIWTSHREDEYIALKFLSEGFNVIVLHYEQEGREAFSVPNDEDLPKNPVSVFPNPLISLAILVKEVRDNRDNWNVDLNHIVVCGFSAGGNLAALLGTNWDKDWLTSKIGVSSEEIKPTHLMLGYPVLDFTPRESYRRMLYAILGKFEFFEEEIDKISPVKNVSENTPKTFIWHTMDDTVVPAMDSIRFASELQKFDINYELHIFNKGGHGLALANSLQASNKGLTNVNVSKWFELFIEWLAPYKSKDRDFYFE